MVELDIRSEFGTITSGIRSNFATPNQTIIMLEVVHSNPKDFQFSEVEIFNFTMHKTERSGSGSNILHPLNLVDPVVVLNFGMHNTSKGSTTFPTLDHKFN